MGDPWTVFVEGKSDKAFVRCLLQFLDISNVEVQRIGGGIDKLKEVAKLMQQHHDAGNRIAIILDADSDPQKRRKEFEKKKKSLNLPIERVFFIPDDKEPGCLETLLEQVSAPVHQAIYNCFENYEDCLRGLDETYKTPNLKARIFAWARRTSTH